MAILKKDKFRPNFFVSDEFYRVANDLVMSINLNKVTPCRHPVGTSFMYSFRVNISGNRRFCNCPMLAS